MFASDYFEFQQKFKTALIGMVFILSFSLCGQTYIGFVNPSFEIPGIEKQQSWDNPDADDVPGWTSDTPAVDSGVETNDAATDGEWTGFIKGSDLLVYQVTEHIIVEGDNITLSVDAKDNWQATTLEIQIFSQDTPGNRVVLESTQVNVTSDMMMYSLNFKSSDHIDAIGKNLGVAFDNTSIDESWIAVDNVRAVNLNPTIEVINYSFELPGLEKIKGWDGECRDPGWTGLLYDIPGWTSVIPPWDSGVETGYTPTDGDWTAFVMGGDSAVYQITNHIIQEGDEIELIVDARITWAAMFLEIGIFYEDNGIQVPLETEIWELLETMEEYFLLFSAADHPEAIGQKLGILFNNVSDSASWIGLDNVRLNNSNPNVAVERLTEPNNFTLSQNYPNPFNSNTSIQYTLETTGKVRLSVFDTIGREVAVLVNDIRSAGDHHAVFNGTGLESGIYFYCLQNEGRTVTRKMILLK